MKKIGIKKIFDISHGRLRGNTVIASNGKEYLTVSKMINIAGALAKFIKDNFDKDEYKYSLTIRFLESIKLVLTNGHANKPTKEQAHTIVDVLHEIEDMNARSEEEKAKNQEIAVAVKCLIDILE